MRPINNKKGFTLLELMIAVTIFAIAISGLGKVTFLAVKSFRRQQKMLYMVQNAEFALDRITSEIASATFVHSSLPNPTNPPKFIVADDAGQSPSNPERLDFNCWTYTSIEGAPSAPHSGEVIELHYRIYNDPDLGYTLQRQVVNENGNGGPIPDNDVQNPVAPNKGNIIAFDCDDLEIQCQAAGSSTWDDLWNSSTLPALVRVTIQIIDPDGEVNPIRMTAQVAVH